MALWLTLTSNHSNKLKKLLNKPLRIVRNMTNCKCKNLNVDTEQKYLLLPTAYLRDTHICSYDSDKGYVIRMKLTSREEFFAFMNKWSVKTHTKWRVRKSDPKEMCAGLKNIFWQAYHCQNTSYRLQGNSTGCKAAFKVTIRKISKRCRSKDVHIPEYPTIIIGHFRHNHAGLFNNNKFQSKGVSEEVVAQFIDLYKSGLSPAAALGKYKQELKDKFKDNYCTSDRPLCPDRKWCQRLYSYVKRKILDIKIQGDENTKYECPQSQFYLKHSLQTLQSLSTNNNTSNIEENNEALKQFAFFTSYIKEKMEQSAEYREAAAAFNESCKGFKSDMELLNALRTFGSTNVSTGNKMEPPVLDRRKSSFMKDIGPCKPGKFEELFIKLEENDHTYSTYFLE